MTCRWQIRYTRKDGFVVFTNRRRGCPRRPRSREAIRQLSLRIRFFEAIYRLLSPYKDPIGLALYFELAVGDQETELEWKILLQKNWLEDRLVWAQTSTTNWNTRRKRKTSAGNEKGCSNGLPGFLSFNAQLVGKVGNFLESSRIWKCHYPRAFSLTFWGRRFIMAVNVGGPYSWIHASVTDWQAFSQDNKEFAAHNGYIFGDEHEKYYVRLRIGFNF